MAANGNILKPGEGSERQAGKDFMTRQEETFDAGALGSMSVAEGWQSVALSGRIDPQEWHAAAEEVRAHVAGLSEFEFAQLVIGQVTDRARAESAIGRHHAVLMSVSQAEIEIPGGRRKVGNIDGEWIKDGTAARVVWQHVTQKSEGYPDDCQPSLEHWENVYEDAEGREQTDGGNNIIIRFKDSTVRPPVPENQYVAEVKAQIFERAEREIRVGRFFSILNSISESEIERPEGGDITICKPEWLRGPAKEIYSHCESLGLNPTIERWVDFTAGKEGYNCVIHW